MRIGINLRSLLPGKIGGLEHHFRGLFGAMLASGRPHRYVLYTNPENDESFAGHGDSVTRFTLKNYGSTTSVAEAVRSTDPDVVFHPFLFVEPAQLDSINAVLIPDARFARYPEGTPANILNVWRRRFPETVRRAELVFTNSESSRADLVELLGADPEKIRVTGLGVEPAFWTAPSAEQAARVAARHGLPREFLFYPADTWPHKNHARLLQALRRLRRAGRRVTLALSGFPNAGEDDVTRLIRKLKLDDQVIRLGYVPRADLPSIYRLATALVFPSYYEGWGMPVSEALASGTPVLCGRQSSLPEVAGDCAVYFNPFDERDMAQQIARLLDDPALREDLARRGPVQAARHTWEEAARITLDGLEQAARPAIEQVDPLPLVSIVVPTYNQGRYLGDCLDSILSQDYPHLEVLVLDAESPDESREILPRYTGRVRWISRKDRGQTDAMNQGLRMARGEVQGYLCSDDLLLPGAVRKAVSYLVGRPECDLVYGQGYHIDADDKIIERYPTEPFDDEQLEFRCFICQPATFWRRRLYAKAGWFDDEVHLHNGMDYEYWMRVARTAKVGWIDDYLALSRLWSGGKTIGRRSHLHLMSATAVKRHFGRVPIVWINNYVDQRTEEQHYERWPHPLDYHARRLYRRVLKTWCYSRFNGMQALFLERSLEPPEAYQDGWMGRSMERKLLVPPFARRLRIRGNLPPRPKVPPPALQVWAGGRYLGTYELTGPGGFTAQFGLPESVRGRHEILVRLRSDRTFIPSVAESGSSDDRRLSCRIEAVELEG